MSSPAMRIVTVIVVATAVLIGAALVRGVGYALTHAVEFSFGTEQPTVQPTRHHPA